VPSHPKIIYHDDNDTRYSWIDLSRANDRDLQMLADACEPATFDIDQRDVLDENHPKVGKMDKTHFATKFDLEQARLVKRIRMQLFSVFQESMQIKAELYKLNVYGV
jgi:hypothetical protein